METNKIPHQFQIAKYWPFIAFAGLTSLILPLKMRRINTPIPSSSWSMICSVPTGIGNNGIAYKKGTGQST